MPTVPVEPLVPVAPASEPLPASREPPRPAATTESAQQLHNLVMADVTASPFSETQAPSLRLEELLGAQLAAKVEARLATSLTPELQNEMAALLSLLPTVQRSLGSTEMDLLRTAVSALVAEGPNVEYARGVREMLNAAIKDRNALFRLPNLMTRSPSALVVVGLGFFAYVIIPLIVFTFAPWLNGTEDSNRLLVMGFPAMDVLVVCVAGAMGSVTSIMIRVREFDATKNSGPLGLILFGFFKPFIGMFFGMFCYAVFHSDLIPALTISQDRSNFFHFAVAFIAGFSERFAQDIASKTEPGLQSTVSRSLDKL